MNAVTAGTGVGGWKTPMIAGSRPYQEFAAPLSTNAGLVSSLGLLASAIMLCLACCAVAFAGGIVLLIAHMARTHRHTPNSPSAQLSLPHPAAHRAYIECGIGRRDDLRVSRLSGRGGSGCDHLDEQLGYAGPRLAWRSGVVLAGTDCVRMADCAIHRHAHTMVAACSRETLAGRRTGRVLPSRWRGDLGRRPHSRFHSKHAGRGAVFAALGVLGTI